MSILDINNAEEKLRRGIILLQNREPFFAYLLMQAQIKPLPDDAPMRTMGVDKNGNIFYDEQFVMELSDAEVRGVLAHEILHVALLHMLRIGNRNPIICNLAQDIVVNMMVTDAGFSLPEGAIPYDRYNDQSIILMQGNRITINKVSEKVWEQIYQEITDDFNSHGFSLEASPLFDNHTYSQSGSNESQDAEQDADVEHKWSNALADAALFAKQQGKLPNGMDRIVDLILAPKVHWKHLLQKYLRPHLLPVDWSYQRPSKKSQILKTYLPNTLKEECSVEILIDTSGSITNAELTDFVSELVSIARAHQHMKMSVAYCDTEIHSHTQVDADINKIIALKPSGGGGTDMEAGLDELRKRTQSSVVIVFTDGYTSFNRSAKDYPFDIIWVLTRQNTAKDIPYGKIITINGG